jgi:hypothetical protein
MSTIKSSTTLTTAYQVVADTTGALVIQTGATPTTAVTVSSAQVVTLANALPVASGGTGATSNAAAPFALKGANSDITSLTGLTTPLSVAQGGTGTTSTTFANLTTNVTGTLPVANGGTGVTSSTGSGANVLGTSPTLTTPTINSAQVATVSGTAPLYLARAWVNFNGTGAVAIRASGNVSSITDNGTGSYAVNLTTAMPDVNYACVMATKGSSGSGTPFLPLEHASLAARTTSSIAFYVIALNGATPDADVVEVVFFR